jgi:hypothetical protein
VASPSTPGPNRPPLRSSHPGTDRRLAGAVAAITLIGLILRLPSFADSLFGDELSAYYIVAHHTFGQVMHLLNYHSTELNPQLFFILAWISQTVLGLSAETMKLPSLIVGTATIPMIYCLGRQAGGARTGLVAAGLAACCPFLIFYSTEARPYALMLFLVLGAALALLRALRSGGVWWWLLYALCTCAAAYTHFTSIFALGAIAVWGLVTQPPARLRILGALALAAVAYVPELPVLHKISQSPGTNLYRFLDPLSAHLVLRDLGRWAIGHPYLTLTHVPGTVALVASVAGLAVGMAGCGLRLAGTRGEGTWRARPPAIAVLVVVLAVASPAGVILYSILGKGVWGARNVIASWGAFAVVLAAIVTYPRRPLRIVAGALLVLGFALAGLSMLPDSVQRPDYQAAVAYMRALAPRGAPVADLPAPTPGPPTGTEAALDLAGVARRYPVSRIGYPTLASVLAAPPYAPLADPSGEAIARQVTMRAHDGMFFIVIPTTLPGPQLMAARKAHAHSTPGPLGYLGPFLGAIPARYSLVAYRTFPGLAPVSVYALRG